MANYGLYANINEGSLQSNVTELISKFTSKQGELESFNGTITEDMWKAESKQTFKNGIDKIVSDAYQELLNKLNDIISVCGYIETYKEAEGNANYNKNLLTTNDDPKGEIAKAIGDNERVMEECESNISSICGG